MDYDVDISDKTSYKKRDSFDGDYVDLDTEKNSVQGKATSIKSAIRVMELRLRGYEWSAKNDKYFYTGRVLAGPIVINKATSLLQPFAEEANLITGKQFSTFSKQKWEVCSTFNKTLLAELGCWSEDYEVVMKIFKNSVQNIGDVILTSKEVLKDWYGQSSVEERNDNNLTG